MNIALLGDIHGNYPALKAVLRHARQKGVRAFWNTGDIIGYGASPNEVIREMVRCKSVSIIGNYDRKVLNLQPSPAAPVTAFTSLKSFAFQWTRNRLSETSLRYLRALPKQKRLEIDGKRILLTHGSPFSDKEYISSDTSRRRLKTIAGASGADILICGHSHRPFLKMIDRVLFVNTGSVGRPDDGDNRPCYAFLTIQSGQVRVRHYHVNYDLNHAVKLMKKARLPDAFAHMITLGRSLEQIRFPSTSARPTEEGLSGKKRLQWQAVNAYAENSRFDRQHSLHVVVLVLQLYDELSELHGMGSKERFWLQCAALLHDIGWIEGQKGHHKTALRLIVQASSLPFTIKQRRIVGCIARYHRRALPQLKHDHYADISPKKKKQVCILAGILRFADGLDAGHQDNVRSIACHVSRQCIMVSVQCRTRSEIDVRAALEKRSLIENTFNRQFLIRMYSP